VTRDGYRAVIGGARPELDRRLSDELDRFNAAATTGTPPADELTVEILDTNGELAAGMSGWTWGSAAGIGMTWVRAGDRGAGLGARLLEEFETEARSRGCRRVFVTSFTFQAPGSTSATATARSCAGRACRPTARPTSTSAKSSDLPATKRAGAPLRCRKRGSSALCRGLS